MENQNKSSKQANKLNERLYTNSLSYNAHTSLTIVLFEDKSLHLILLWYFEEKRWYKYIFVCMYVMLHCSTNAKRGLKRKRKKQIQKCIHYLSKDSVYTLQKREIWPCIRNNNRLFVFWYSWDRVKCTPEKKYNRNRQTHTHRERKEKRKRKRVKANGSGNNNESTLYKDKELEQILLRIKWETFNVKCPIFYSMDLRKRQNKTKLKEMRSKKKTKTNDIKMKKEKFWISSDSWAFLFMSVRFFCFSLSCFQQQKRQRNNTRWVNYMGKSTKLDENKQNCVVWSYRYVFG